MWARGKIAVGKTRCWNFPFLQKCRARLTVKRFLASCFSINITVTMNCEFAKFSAYPQLEKFAKNLPSNHAWISSSNAHGYCFHMHLDAPFTYTWMLASHALVRKHPSALERSFQARGFTQRAIRFILAVFLDWWKTASAPKKRDFALAYSPQNVCPPTLRTNS